MDHCEFQCSRIPIGDIEEWPDHPKLLSHKPVRTAAFPTFEKWRRISRPPTLPTGGTCGGQANDGLQCRAMNPTVESIPKWEVHLYVHWVGSSDQLNRRHVSTCGEHCGSVSNWTTTYFDDVYDQRSKTAMRRDGNDRWLNGHGRRRSVLAAADKSGTR